VPTASDSVKAAAHLKPFKWDEHNHVLVNYAEAGIEKEQKHIKKIQRKQKKTNSKVITIFSEMA